MRCRLLAALLSLSLLLSIVAAAQNPSYTFTTLDVPFPGANSTVANRINDRGQQDQRSWPNRRNLLRSEQPAWVSL